MGRGHFVSLGSLVLLLALGLAIWSGLGGSDRGPNSTNVVRPGVGEPLPPDQTTSVTVGAGNVGDGGPKWLSESVPKPLPGDSGQALYDRLLGKSVTSLWGEWDDAWLRADLHELQIWVSTLGANLRRTSDNGAYDEAARRLTDSQRTLSERMGVVDALIYASTPQAAAILLDFLRENENPQTGLARHAGGADALRLLERTREAIGEIAGTRVSGSRNWAVSAELESFWRFREEATSRQTLTSVGSAIAYLARPEGAQLLIDTAANSPAEDPARQIALNALASLRANDVVDVVSNALSQPGLGAAQTRALVLGLLSIGSLDAAQALDTNLARVRGGVPDLLPRVEAMLAKYRK